MFYHHLLYYINANIIQNDIKPLDVFYNKLLRSISGCMHDTFIGDLYLFSNLNPISEYFKTHSAKWWHRALHIPKNNELYHCINKYWYKIWQKHIYKNTQKNYKLNQYLKKSILWQSYTNAKKFNILKICNFKPNTKYDQHYRLKNIYTFPITLPNYVIYFDEPYTDYHPVNDYMPYCT